MWTKLLTCASKLEIVSEALRDLKSELFSAKPEAEDSEPTRDLNNEFFPAKPEAEDSEPVRDRNSELFSAKLETELSEALKALARPLTSEAATERTDQRPEQRILPSKTRG